MTDERRMGLEIIEGETKVPEVVLPQRIDGEFVTLDTQQQFAGKRVIVFGLPGAFTPTCSTQQLPSFDERFEEFREKGIDEIYCVSVNDTFVMNSWFESLGIKNVYPLPDGNGEFTHLIGAECSKSNLGFGYRSWRYAVVINDGVIEKAFIEDGYQDNAESDLYETSSPENILKNL
jgi:peroxiredoxin